MSADRTTRGRYLRFVQFALLCAALASGISEAALTMHYYAARPRLPDHAAARTTPLNVHGVTVYLTTGERAGLEGLRIATGTCFFSIVAIEILRRYGQTLHKQFQGERGTL